MNTFWNKYELWKKIMKTVMVMTVWVRIPRALNAFEEKAVERRRMFNLTFLSFVCSENSCIHYSTLPTQGITFPHTFPMIFKFQNVLWIIISLQFSFYRKISKKFNWNVNREFTLLRWLIFHPSEHCSTRPDSVLWEFSRCRWSV